MCSCFGSSLVLHNDSNRPEIVQEEEPVSFSVSTQLKDVVVRIVYAGGRIEMYEKPLPASLLIRRNSGMCITKPDVFKHPHESVLSPDDMLLPGNKYFVVRSTTVEKLKRRKRKNSESSDSGETVLEESGDFCVSKNGWSVLRQQMKENKQFVPPIQRPRIWKEPDWEPSLTSIVEVSL